MNEKYIIAQEEGLKNFERDGKVAGFEFRLRIPYYQGAPFSQIEHLRAFIDGEEIPQEDLRICAETGEEFKMSEIVSVNTYYWEYGAKLRVLAMKDGGLAPGQHRLDVDVCIDVIYAPGAFSSKCWAQFTV